tara:strand:- start:71 stop:403 length:333 start_codon:yes stop_codon:yes gene_type:complete
MFIFVVKNILTSVIIIALLHYIYNYLKNNLSTPKIKDLVYKPKIRYDQIIEVIKNSEMTDIKNKIIEKESIIEEENSIQEDKNMVDELEEYMNNISNIEETEFTNNLESI